ncbi:DUF2330 domain-containing protein [Myxococcota bacterium]|nr:DUF2330 domain-containing protein [Myxococcota bacterium]
MSRLHCALALLLGLSASPALAVVIAPAPGETVKLQREQIILVFDPLTASQTLVIQHQFEGTQAPFGLLIPTPQPATVSVLSERIVKAVGRRLHPRGKTLRVLDVEVRSFIGGCAIREVGGGHAAAQAPKNAQASAASKSLGGAPEPLHDWLLSNGFTLAPAQTRWLDELRLSGWSLTGIVVRPPTRDGAPQPTLRGPVLALTHAAEEPRLAAAHPAFALSAPLTDGPPLEVAVLTEWAVRVDSQQPPRPFFADILTGPEVARISAEAGGLPWSFRRAGTLTAFKVERPASGVLNFTRMDPRPPIRPAPAPNVQSYHLQIPLELLLALGPSLLWLWLRHGRRRRLPQRLL